eukprot:scaffold2830_cov32-Cyclotella_meneghiniana.AAC.1
MDKAFRHSLWLPSASAYLRFQHKIATHLRPSCLSSPLLSAIRQRYPKPLAIRHPSQVASHWPSHLCFHHDLFHLLWDRSRLSSALPSTRSNFKPSVSQLDVARLVRTSVAISLEIGWAKNIAALLAIAQGWPGFPKPVFNWSFYDDMTSAMGLTAAHNITQSSHSLLLLVPLVPEGSLAICYTIQAPKSGK